MVPDLLRENLRNKMWDVRIWARLHALMHKKHGVYRKKMMRTTHQYHKTTSKKLLIHTNCLLGVKQHRFPQPHVWTRINIERQIFLTRPKFGPAQTKKDNNHILSSFMIYQIFEKSNTTCAYSGAGTTNPSIPPKFIGVCFAQSFVFCVVFCRSLFFCFLLAIVLSIL